MNKGGTIKPLGPAIKVTFVRAEHSSDYVWKHPACVKDEPHVRGEESSFIIELENDFNIWHMGDSGVLADIKLIADVYKPDLALMSIGGGRFVMNPTDAPMATREFIKPKAVIPMHHGTNLELPRTPAEYQAALGSSETQVLALQPGENHSI